MQFSYRYIQRHFPPRNNYNMHDMTSDILKVDRSFVWKFVHFAEYLYKFQKSVNGNAENTKLQECHESTWFIVELLWMRSYPHGNQYF